MTLDNPYWENMRLGALDEARKLGVELTLTNAKEDPNLQIEQIREFIAQRLDAVCVVPMKREPLVNGIRALNEAGIPVILVNRDVAEGCDYVSYVGTDTYAGAVASARLLMRAIGGKGEIIELHQVLGSGPEIARSQALQDVLKEYPEAKSVARAPHEMDRGRCVATVQALLERYPNLRGLYVHGDDFAVAAADACLQAGRTGIAVVGMGGSQEAIDAIRSGKLAGTSYQRPEEEGRSAVRLAVRRLRGEKLEKSYPVECPAIHRGNAGEFKGQF
jgi:ABC-type sugar transport system substrate-binding protein